MKYLIWFLCVTCLKTAVCSDGQTLASLINGESQHLTKLHAKLILGIISPKSKMTKADMLATNNAKQFIEIVKKSLKHRRGNLNIPSLDPFVMKEINLTDVDVNINSIKGSSDIYLKNMVVRGVRGIVMKNLAIQLKGYRLDFDFQIPILTIDVDYFADANLMMGLFNFNVNGQTSIVLRDLRIRGILRGKQEQHNHKSYMQIKAVHASLDIGKGKITVTGLANDAVLNYIKEYLTTPTRQIVDNNKEDIIRKAGQVILHKINAILKKIAAKEVMSLSD